MSIEVLLLNNIKNVGKVGEIVSVRDGYARNFLFPQGLGAKVTKAAIRQIESRKAKIMKDYEDAIAAAKQLAEKVQAVSVVIAVQAGDDERLFGSVTITQIQEAVAKQGYTFDKRAFSIKDGIRTLGEHHVSIELHPEVQAQITVKVERA